jgi:hypothetical protein
MLMDNRPPDGQAASALREVRRRADYTPAEQEFSRVLQTCFQDLLEGKRNQLAILRTYPASPDRLGVMCMPSELDRRQLRLPVVETLSWRILEFVSSDGSGGPIAQGKARDGSTVESQSFPTKYPHIVIERTDRYLDGQVEPTEITWCLHRVQNQRAQTQLNRILDAANLAFELLRIVL